MSKFQKAIVVGASSGIGKELALLLARSGCQVVAVARSETKLLELAATHPDKILPLVHDVTQFSDVEKAFHRALEWLGGLDLIIYSSGVLSVAPEGEFDTAGDLEMIEVNCSGAVAWLNLAAQKFEAQGSGTVLGIGSVAGDRGRAGKPVYHASKAFLHTYLESLRNRFGTSGPVVTTVKPGPVDTPMTAQLSFRSKMPAELAAKKILRLAGQNRECYLSIVHRIVFAVLRAIPSPIFRRLKLP